MRIRPLLQIGAPLVAVATLMLGLRVGARSAIHAAQVFGAPAGRRGPDGKTRFAWQLLTFLDDRGVKESISLHGLTVVARAEGREARWAGDSNADGIAEVGLVWDGEIGHAIDLEVRADGDPRPLARGRAEWSPTTWGSNGGDGAVRPTKREGAIGLDVVVEQGRLIPGFPSSVWVHTTPPLAALPIIFVPEPGLRAEKETTTTCVDGWAEATLVADAHVTGGTFETRLGDRKGTWFGAIPVAPGAFFASIPRVIDVGMKETAVLVAPNPRTVVYAEVDDEQGRIAAATLPLVTETGDAVPSARFSMPPLAAGLHWIVVSGEPRGAEHLGGVTIAKPFLVGSADGVSVQSACSVGPWLARRQAAGFPRWLALDGAPERSSDNRRHRTIGLFVALLSLAAAALLEVLLLVASARETRAALRLAALDDEEGARITASTPGGSIAIAALLAVLGFGLLAVLLFVKS